MTRTSAPLKSTLAALVALTLVGPATPITAITPSARCADLTGTFGLGAEVAGSPLSGGESVIGSALSLKYWISALGFQALTSLGVRDVNSTDPDTGEVSTTTPWTLNLAFRALYNLTRTDSTHLFVGAGISLRLVIDGDGDDQALDLLLGVEHFFTRYFAVSGHVGAHIGLGSGVEIEIGRAAAWGTSFHFYF